MLNSKDEYRRTIDVNDEVAKCESIVELKEILNQNSTYYQEWKFYINRLMEQSHMNYMQMAKNCHCSRNTVKKWCREGIMPQNRDVFIKIGLAFRLDLEEFNRMLQRYGKCPKLYAKNMDDAIVIFLVTHYPKEGDAYECYLQLKELLLKRMRQSGEGIAGERDTTEIEEELLSKKTQEEFEDFIIVNQKSYQESFQKLIEYLSLFISEKGESIHHFIQSNGLDFSYEKMLSALKQKRESPNRLRLILLGVNLNMSLEQINHMLSLAYMEPMCAKDDVECVIMYVVEDAYLLNPAYSVESAMILQHYEQNPRLQEKCKAILKKYWVEGDYNDKEDKDIKERANAIAFIESSISDYLRYVLKELEWEEDIFKLL